MKRNILKIAFMATALTAGVFVSCNEEEIDPNKGEHSGKKVSFSISEADTKTAYDPNENLQINWVKDDKVRIFCDEAEDVKQADYTVAQIEKNTGKLVAYEDEKGLAWGGDDDVHNFYAVYPADDKTVASMENGKLTVNANLNQVCTLGSKVGNMYETTPDMTNAIMVAKLSTKPADDVGLTFKPIMTTLEVVVRGGETENIAVEVTGISINMEASAYGASSKQFVYDINSGELVRGNLNSSVQFFVAIKGKNEINSVKLAKGESVKFTAFLPPVPINGDHKISIRVHATGSTELKATIGGATKDNSTTIEIAQSSKRRITLPLIKEDDTRNNNWITPLDDNIYVQQMSIPGTHDSAANETSLSDAGQTQSKTIEEQFNMGIRAFDLRTAYNTDQGRMWMYHGYSNCYKSLNTVLTTLSNKLKENPGEFIFIQFRHEDESSFLLGGTEKDPDKWSEIYNELKNFDKQIVQWRNDLTIGECRGKMIIVTRHDYTNRTKVALVANFPENSLGNATLNENTTYYVQDYYKYTFATWNTGSEDYNGKKKIGLIKSLIETTNKFCDAKSTDYINKSWTLNHTSGYCASSIIGGIGVGSTSQYQQNASLVNPEIYKYLQSQTTHGPLGIVFMDWVGAREAASYSVYGDLLPQTVIDNNYMYHMLRKGE